MFIHPDALSQCLNSCFELLLLEHVISAFCGFRPKYVSGEPNHMALVTQSRKESHYLTIWVAIILQAVKDLRILLFVSSEGALIAITPYDYPAASF